MNHDADSAEPSHHGEPLVRELRQRLESLVRAGVKDLPLSSWRPPVRPPQTVPDRPTLDTSAPVQTVSLAASPRPEQIRNEAAGATRPTTSGALFQESGFETPPLAIDDRLPVLRALAAEVAGCRKCAQLAETRTQTVFADGYPAARLMFIGEAPGADEDRTGRPFVGRAGQLLTDMITKGMGLSRDEVYIANILKCRPPDNREPTHVESANCMPYLVRQIEIVRPEFLCLLGRTAVAGLLGTTLSMGRLRGKWHRYRGIATIATYHPSYLLRTPSAKKDAWEDLKILMNAMGLPVRGRNKDQP